jgi:Ion channel
MSVASRGEERYEIVLVLILAVLVFAPFESTLLRPLIVASLGFIFIFTLWTSGSTRWLVTAATTFTAIGVIVAAISQVSGETPQRIGYVLISMLLSGGTIAAIMTRLASHTRVTRHTVTGALSIYLLIGLLFAYVYGFVALVGDGRFFAQAGRHNPVSFLYFSYITLTTIGYGDLTARTDLGRMLAVIEAVLGQLYLVTIVAVVVGNIGRERTRRLRKQER